MFRGALEFVDRKTPIVMVEAWNEWGEGACIEPDKRYGFGYLEQIAHAMGHTLEKPRVPSSGEIASWSALTPKELAAATAIEGQLWAPVKPIYLDLGRNRQVAPVKLPIALDFREGGVKIQSAGGQVERRDATGALFVSASNDPQVVVRTPDIPASQVKRVIIYAEVPKGGSNATVTLELFFHTALYPQSSAFCSAQLGPLRSKQVSVATSEIMGWDKFGTPITAIRIDPGDRPGDKVLLRRIRIE
jgi:hypothetical protein